jgi:hypothetical protein
VLVDVPKDVQQQLHVPRWDEPMSIASYISRLPPPPELPAVQQVVWWGRQADREQGGAAGGVVGQAGRQAGSKAVQQMHRFGLARNRQTEVDVCGRAH